MAVFNDTRPLKFKTHLTIAFFADVNYNYGDSQITLKNCWIQWNPVNTDTKGTRQNVRIIGVSVIYHDAFYSLVHVCWALFLTDVLNIG